MPPRGGRARAYYSPCNCQRYHCNGALVSERTLGRHAKADFQGELDKTRAEQVNNYIHLTICLLFVDYLSSAIFLDNK